MKCEKIYFILYSFCCLIYYIKSDIQFENLNISNKDTFIGDFIGDKFYHIIPESKNYLKNYMKITVIEKTPSSSNHAISYYQSDSSFKNRKQLSENITDTVVMWLKKEQFQKDFYLSIEFEIPSQYNITITFHKYIELNIIEQYHYYVNEENKEMNFLFRIDLTLILVSGKIIVWAKGDKKINSTLEGIDYIKHQNYNSYLIVLKYEAYYYNINLDVTGQIGDLIDVGSLMFIQMNGLNYFARFPLTTGYFYGYLKKGLLDNNCFRKKSNNLVNYKEKALAIDLEHDNIQMPISKQIINQDDYLCINLTEEYDELFYSFYYLTYNNVNYKDVFLKTILGVGIQLSIPIDYNAGFIPLKLTENFKFLSFIIQVENNEDAIIECSIYTCDNYPFCSLNSTDKKKNIPIKNFYNYYEYTFTKDELGKNYSPISKEQKLAKIRFKEKSYYSDSSIYCYVNIYNDKSYILSGINTYSPVYKLIRKEQIEKIIFYNEQKYNSYNPPRKFYIVFEKISGDISINSKNFGISITNSYSYKNYYLYYCEINSFYEGPIFLSFNITGRQDSVYSLREGLIDLKYLEKGFGLVYGLSKGNILLKFDNENDIILDIMDSFSKSSNKFINLFSPNCKIGVKNMIVDSDNEDNINFEKLNLKYGFFQEIYFKRDDSKYLNVYLEEENQNKKEECMLYINNYNIPSGNIAFNNSIYLDENFPQSFAFNKNRSLIKFEYYFVNKKNNLNIAFNLLNKGSYNIRILIEDKEKKKINKLNSNSTTTLKPKNWKDICTVQQKCNLSFTVSSDDTEEESYLQIIINTKEGKDDGPSGSKTILIVVFSIVAAIIIIGGIFIFLKFRKKSNLREEIENLPENKEGQLLS